jgi:hypothetical protein
MKKKKNLLGNNNTLVGEVIGGVIAIELIRGMNK